MRRKPTNPRAVDRIDRVIGEQIRQTRLAQGKTQTELGDRIGVTFQQVQKIERGVNRIAASRLYKVAKALGTPVQKFFGE